MEANNQLNDSEELSFEQGEKLVAALLKEPDNEGFVAMKSEHFEGLLGEYALDRINFPVVPIREVDVYLVKYPFCKPKIKQRFNRKLWFSRLRETIYYLDWEEMYFVQSSSILSFSPNQSLHLLPSMDLAFEVAVNELVESYNQIYDDELNINNFI